MKDFLNKKYILFPLVSLVLALVTAVSLILALKYSFDFTLGYFDYSSPAFVVLETSAVLGVILALAAALTSRNYVLAKRPVENIATVFGGTFASVICLFNIFGQASDLAKGGFSIGELENTAKLNLLTALLQIFIPVFFLLVLSNKTRVSRIRGAVGSLGAMSFVAYLFASYFDFTLPINSPMRYLNVIATGCCALFMLGESRLAFPKTANRPPYRLSLVSSALSTAVCLGISVGFIISSYFITGAAEINPNPPILFSALYAAVSITSAGRLLSLKSCGKFSPKPKDKPENKPEEPADEKTENN